MLNRADTRKGFTLMELLVVMAISVILLGLVMVPLVKTFSLTRAAGALVDAQDSARSAVAQLSRDIAETMFVYDSVDTNTGNDSFGMAAVYLPYRMNDGSIGRVLLPDSRMDMIPPQMVVHCNDPRHYDFTTEPRDYSRRDEHSELVYAWKACPACGSADVEVRPNLPLRHDNSIVRYFLGLRDNDPTKGWKPYDLESKAPGDANPVVLYRVQFDPADPSLFAAGTDAAIRRAVYNDPNFFYDSNPAADGRPFWMHWKEMASPVAAAKYQDLITSSFNAAGEPLDISPTVSLRFAGVENTDFRPQGSSIAGAYGILEPPTTFKAPDGYWVSSFGTNSPPSFVVSVFKASGIAGYSTRMESASGHLYLFKYTQVNGNWEAPQPVFDITEYLNTGNIVNPNGGQPDMAFIVDYEKGIVDFAITPELDASGTSISSLDPEDINNDVDRRALLKTYDSGSPNHLGPNASIITDTMRVQVPVDVVGGKPVYVRFLKTDEGAFKPGRNQFWLEAPSYIRFSNNLPVIANPAGGNFPVLVDYRVQYNTLGDSVRGSYATKSRVDFTIGMRVYNPDSHKPSNFALKDTVVVGNALR